MAVTHKSVTGEEPNHLDTNGEAEFMQLDLLNGFLCTFNGKDLPLKSLKARAIVACAVLSENGVVSRESLKARLWSQSNEKRAQDSLRRAILDIRKAFTEIEFQHFGTDRESFFIKPGNVNTDITQYLDSLATLIPDSALSANAHSFDNLLIGFDRIDAVFAEWLRLERSAIRRRAENALQQQIDAEVHSDTALNQVARLLLEINPSHEQACAILIRTYLDAGDSVAACAQFQSFADYQQSNFSRSPSSALQCLISDSRIPNEAVEPPQVPATLTQPANAIPESKYSDQPISDHRAPVIVVMPLIKSDETSKRFPVGSGFRFELVGALVRFREWVVVDIATDNHIDNLQNCDEAVYRLELRTIEDTDNFSLTVNFSDFHSGKLIWSDHWRNQHNDWVAMQHHVVGQLAVAMNLSLSHVRLQGLLSSKSYSLSAYDNWLLAQENLLAFTPQSWTRASDLLRNLATQWPSFARTYSSLSQMENLRHLSLPGFYSNAKTQKLAREYAVEAVRLDPLDSRAQLCLGWSYAMSHDFNNAKVTFIRASELNEHDCWTTISSAVGLAFSGESETATELSQRAARLQLLPTSVYWSYQAAVKFLCEDFEGCVTDSVAADEITVDVPAWHAAALFHIGNTHKARQVYARFIEIVRQRWAINTEPNIDAIADWLSQCFPLKSLDSRRNLVQVLNQLSQQCSEANEVSNPCPPKLHH